MKKFRGDVIQKNDINVGSTIADDLTVDDGFGHTVTIKIDNAIPIRTRLTNSLEATVEVRHVVDMDIACATVLPVWITTGTLKTITNNAVRNSACREMSQVRRQIIRVENLLTCEIARYAAR